MSIGLLFEKQRKTIEKKVNYIVPERLEQARLLRGMTQKETAEKMGITLREYAKLESFNCSHEVLINYIFDIMRVFKLPKKYFYYEVWKRMP